MWLTKPSSGKGELKSMTRQSSSTPLPATVFTDRSLKRRQSGFFPQEPQSWRKGPYLAESFLFRLEKTTRGGGGGLNSLSAHKFRLPYFSHLGSLTKSQPKCKTHYPNTCCFNHSCWLGLTCCQYCEQGSEGIGHKEVQQLKNLKCWVSTCKETQPYLSQGSQDHGDPSDVLLITAISPSY